MDEKAKVALAEAKTVLVIQAENPDGDSLGSAMALEEIFGDMGKEVHLYCPVEIPKYLRYVSGWDRVSQDWPGGFDLAVIVDTASEVLLERALVPGQRSALEKVPVIVLDHHQTESTLPFETIPVVNPDVVATGELITQLAQNEGWAVNPQAAEHLSIALLSDSLGLTTPNVTAASVHALAKLVEFGANLSVIENRRRDFMKKTAEILEYKGHLIGRIEYHLDGKLALIHIPWEEIAKHSDQYNPSMLVLDEMRLVEGVRIAAAFKTYPDTKVTAKIRTNPDTPIAETVAGFFGGGGHLFASGFRTYDDYETVKNEFIANVDKVLGDLENDPA